MAVNYQGALEGHSDWVTSVSTSFEAPEMIVSGSRDKKLIVWQLTPQEEQYGYARKALTGHNGAVSDVVISSDGQFALSGSWDKTLRLWDLNTGAVVRTFKGHTSDVFAVAFSQDNRQIVSGSRDKTIKLWNTLAECKYTIDDAHSDWVSCVRFSPAVKTPTLVSAGWDKVIKVWGLSDMNLKSTLAGHNGPVYGLSVSPDGSLCASAGKDGNIMLWDVAEGKHLYHLEAGAAVNAVAFSPKNYWLVAATDSSVKLWDLETKELIEEIVPVSQSPGGLPWAVSVSWSADGNVIFVGATDSKIHCYEVEA